jgi:hypothetical protein
MRFRAPIEPYWPYLPLIGNPGLLVAGWELEVAHLPETAAKLRILLCILQR